jgi:hypothetical protein
MFYMSSVYVLCVSYIPLIATVWYIYHRPMEHVNDWYWILRIVLVSPHDACSSCYHSMTHVLHVIGLCIMLRCDTDLYEVWGPPVSLYINTLWQPDRLTWSVYSITSVCSEMISCMLSCAWYSHMMLSIYNSCSPCYRSMLTAAMRYCIVWRPSWGPSLCDTSRWI